MTKMKITDRDKRALVLAGFAAVAIVLWFGVLDSWFADWKMIRTELKAKQARFDSVAASPNLSPADKGLFSIVPVFEMPAAEQQQGPAYMKKINEQLKKLEIKAELKFLKTIGSKSASGFKTLRLQSQGKCKYTQVMDLLVKLYENPYFVAVERLTITADPKKAGQVDFTLVTSTFAK
jgi:hypothetical protein